MLAAILASPPAAAALWLEATDTTIGVTAEWSNKVELADINGDGLVDILFANGGNYNSAGEPQQNRAFLNQGPGMPFLDASTDVFGDTGDLARAIKVADFNGDGVVDIIVATTYQTRSRLYLGLGAGSFLEVTETHTPTEVRSFGDVEVGDLDEDGDLDLVLADWGGGNPQSNAGAVPRIWLNDGNGVFSDVTLQRMPVTLVQWSWDLELVDVDNDFDLDLAVSCKSCSGQFLFDNDGDGYFDNAHEAIPATSNNYELAPMDFDGDGWMDMATVNDAAGLDENVFLNDGAGALTAADETVFPAEANIGEDDNVVEWLDVDSDGDADFVIGSLSGADRLLSNNDGVLALTDTNVFEGSTTPGTLGMAFADLDGDMKLDVVMSQGETADPEAVFLGDEIAPDTAAPTLGAPRIVVTNGVRVDLHIRIHDRKSPSKPEDWGDVRLDWTLEDGETQTETLQWYGEYLWRATFVPPYDGVVTWSVCASDAAGNEACTDPETTNVFEFGDPPMPEPEPEPAPEIGPEAPPEETVEERESDLTSAPDAAPDAGPDAGEPDATGDADATAEAVVEGPAPTPPPADDGCSSGHSNGPDPWAGLMALMGLLTAAVFRRKQRV